MLGVLAALLASIGALGIGLFLVRRLIADLDITAQLGLAGLIGLGAFGTLTLFIGVLPGGLSWGLAVMIPLVIAGWAECFRRRRDFRISEKPAGGEWLWAAILALGFLFALIAVLTPSTAGDWDSIAYHMAVPKMYALAGTIHRIVFIHHSNFPSAIELLFTWAILPLGQSWAKSFLLIGSGFGAFAIFGFARARYGRQAAWIASAVFLTVPIVLWESGTAYIDAVHGLFGGLAVVLLADALEKDEVTLAKAGLAGILLGFACGTKYTGLLTTVLALIVFAGACLILKRKQWPKQAGLIVLASFLVGGCWYVKNILWVQNPVYPFEYSVLGGKDWNQERSVIYRQEQSQFGVGESPDHKAWLEIGHAVLGLAYQPGRYVNPMESTGGGLPSGAVGIAFFAGLLFWCAVRRPKTAEGVMLAFVGLSFVGWFGLSQQSRYMTDIVPLAAILAGGAAVEKGLGKVVAAAAMAQAGYSLYFQKVFSVDPGLPVVLGKVSQSDYLNAALPFHQAAADINALPDQQGVALYDQVFGYYLNKSYFWANPPHCTVIPYPSMANGDDYVRDLHQLGLGYVYVQFVDRDHDRDFAAALGLFGPPVPLPAALRQQWCSDWIQQWKPLLADAVARGDATIIKGYRFGVLIQLKEPPPAN